MSGLADVRMPSGWFDIHVTKEANKDVLKLSDRSGNLIGAIIALAFAVYFVDLYNSDSGFFADDITNAELALFFGIAFLGILPGLFRLITGRKNKVRPLDIAMSVAILIASVWFLSTFPFNFDHLADSMPGSLEFLLSWVDDGIAKLIMMFSIVVNIFLIPYTVGLYFGVRKKLATML